MAGPIEHPEKGIVHQVEIGITRKGKKETDAVRMMVPTGNTAEALDIVTPLVKQFLEKYYAQPK